MKLPFLTRYSLLLTLNCVFLVCLGCVTVKPDAPPAGIVLDDPRIDVRTISKNEPAPGDGVWMNQWTFERLTEKKP